MNSIKLQDTKLIHRNLLCFYTLTINYQKAMTVPTKENALALAAVDNGGKHMQEQGQSRVGLESELTPQKVQRLALSSTKAS